MKKIMFNDKYCLTQAVLTGDKTMTRRLLKDNVPLGNWEETAKHLPYKVGEVVAIAQRYAEIPWNCFPNAPFSLDAFIEHAGYKNKMFVKADLMPHHIKITDVKVERLQDISDEDILREGVWQFYDNKKVFHICKNTRETTSTICFLSAREAFEYLIDKVSGKGTWDSNPLVVAYSFKLLD
ncbi:hypothetical protein [Prevotella intermedia]|uniref:Uncharacterized protein n=1 Tax=Prevotella intermedia TaxID=28131 RepID=A0A2G9ID95_PREIN|nr:hypothetical protein [Prevotella intermedia]PIN27580.1 hypothetical protein CUC04_09450 [Prevotella intermedia]